MNEAIILQSICHLSNLNNQGISAKQVSLEEILQLSNYLFNLFTLEFIDLKELDLEKMQAILDHLQNLNLIEFIDSNTVLVALN